MQRSDLTIDEYGEGDIDEIISIEKDSFPTPWSANTFRNEVTSPPSRLLVGRRVRDEGTCVAGYILYWLIMDELHLHNIAVRRDLRRQGIATRLLAEAVRRSRSEGIRSVTLEVRRSNLPAQRFYEKLGFTVEGVRPGYYTDTPEDALIMWADLKGMPLDPPGTAKEGERGNG